MMMFLLDDGERVVRVWGDCLGHMVTIIKGVD